MKKKYDICIVGGLGHVGLPLGVVFASKGLSVCLHDINDKTAKIKSSKGRSYNIPIHSFSSSDVAYMKTWWTNKNK